MAKESTAASKPGKGNKDAHETRPSDRGRHQRIAEAAYYKAERRNFAPGNDQHDWYEAEREVDGQPAGI